MLGPVRRLKRLVVDLPRNAKLAYCLAFDPRVPARNKAALGVAVAAIVTPVVDIPLWIPVLGEMDAIALGVLATQLFISAAPQDVVREQEALISAQRSRFDEDLQQGRRLAMLLSRRLRSEPADSYPRAEVIGIATQPAPREETIA